MSAPLSHPTVAAVKAIHAEVLAAHGGSAGVRDEALLESAAAAPQATMMGSPLFSDPVEIAQRIFFTCAGTTRSWMGISVPPWPPAWYF